MNQSNEPNGRTTSSRADHLALLTTYGNIILYALCYQVQKPVEPFLVKSLSEQAGEGNAAYISLTYGRLETFFSAIQTIGSPLVGILLDRIGIRKTSALVFLASAASYAILSQATTLGMLFLSKVPTVLQHAFLVAQATAATSTGGNAADRAQALGRMTTAYTIGATVGPALGGFLVDEMGDLYLGAKLAVFGSLVSVVLSLLFLRDASAHEVSSGTVTLERKRSFVQDLQNSVEIAKRSALWPLLVIKVVGGMAASMHSTALPLVLTQKLQFDPSQLGLSMSSSALAVAAFGAVAMAPLTSMFGSAGLAKAGLLMRALMAGVIATIVSSYSVDIFSRVVVASVFHAIASHALATALTTQTTGAVSNSEQGALLGLEHGLFSLARIVGPSLGTTLLARGPGGFVSVAGACATIDVILMAGLGTTGSPAAPRSIPSRSADPLRGTPAEKHSD